MATDHRKPPLGVRESRYLLLDVIAPVLGDTEKPHRLHGLGRAGSHKQLFTNRSVEYSTSVGTQGAHAVGEQLILILLNRSFLQSGLIGRASV